MRINKSDIKAVAPYLVATVYDPMKAADKQISRHSFADWRQIMQVVMDARHDRLQLAQEQKTWGSVLTFD